MRGAITWGALALLATAVQCPSGAAEPQRKCPPPTGSIVVEAVRGGNEWVEEVQVGTPASVDLTVAVPAGVLVTVLRYEIYPDGPGPAIGGPGWEAEAPPGPPVVWWRRHDGALGPGQYEDAVSWDGTTSSGDTLPPGRYHLQVFAEVQHVAPPRDRCDREAGSVAGLAGGLGYFEVAPSG